MVTPPAISTDGLTKFYGKKVGVEDITFSVEPGEVVGFLGPNGSGKTTVLRMLVGLISMSRGTARLFGHDVGMADDSLRSDVGYLPGTLGLYEHMTAADYFLFIAKMRRRDCTRRATELCDRLALDPTQRIKSMSKGTRQKVGVVQAFMHAPKVLLLDEPTSGLDPIVQHAFQDLLTEVSREGTSVLLSSHVLTEVERLASRVAIVNHGRLVAFERVKDLPGRDENAIVLEFDTPAQIDLVSDVAGFTVTRCDGRFIEGTCKGSQRDLLTSALRGDLMRVHSPDPSLDELFRNLVETNHSLNQQREMSPT
jgi:ABC-2 type transport system ATP-binding protein